MSSVKEKYILCGNCGCKTNLQKAIPVFVSFNTEITVCRDCYKKIRSRENDEGRF